MIAPKIKPSGHNMPTKIVVGQTQSPDKESGCGNKDFEIGKTR